MGRKVLPIALMFMRGCPPKAVGLSPYEICTGCLMQMINTPFPQNRLTLTGLDDDMVRYCALKPCSEAYLPKAGKSGSSRAYGGTTPQHRAWRLGGDKGPQEKALAAARY